MAFTLKKIYCSSLLYEISQRHEGKFMARVWMLKAKYRRKYDASVLRE